MAGKWKKEVYSHHKKIGTVAFWRYPDGGFVEIGKVQEGAPARSYSKYMVSINAPNQLDTKWAKTLAEARKIATKWMKGYAKRVERWR